MTNDPRTDQTSSPEAPEIINMGAPVVYITGLMQLSDWLQQRQKKKTP